MNASFDLSSKVIVVTGALGLLGRAYARSLANRGAHVVLADLDQKALDSLLLGLGDASSNCLALSVNVTDKTALITAKDRVLDRFGRIDALVNNAAINDKFESPEAALTDSMFEHFSAERFRQSFEVNVFGVFLAAQVFGAPMAERGAGSIVNVASTYGEVAPNQDLYVRPDGTRAFYKSPSYPTTKGAVLSFTRYLAAYWGHRKVRVNSLSPGGVYNKQEDWFVEQYAQRTMLGRMATEEDMCGALAFLCSDASLYMTGSNLVVDGGFTAW